MAGRCVDDALINAFFPHQLLLFGAVLFRPLLKVQIMQDAHGLPEIRFSTIAQLVGIPAHHIAHNAGVLAVELTFVIIAHQRISLFRGRDHRSTLQSRCYYTTNCSPRKAGSSCFGKEI